MRNILKKIHMYAGLMSFTALIVYGVSGLYSTSQPSWADRPYGNNILNSPILTP